jgi:hypothetical protein
MGGEKRASVDPVTAAENVRQLECMLAAERKSKGLPLKSGARDDQTSQTAILLHRRSRQQLSKAMQLLNPPPYDRKRLRGKILNVLDFLDHLENLASDELEVGLGSWQGKAALARYIRDLRKLKASHAALNGSIRAFLLMRQSAIESDIIEAEAMRVHCGPRPRNRPVNKRVRAAVREARFLLEGCGCEPTTARNGKWHELAKVLGDTDRDLRHYMHASLAEY